MWAKSEKEEPMGTYVVYHCRTCGWEVKEFESK